MANEPVVKPEVLLQKDVNQIYPIVNTVFKQMTGREDLQAVDTASLVAMGTELENLQKTEVWLNTLARRIGRTIDTYRPYENKFKILLRDNMEWGANVRKIDADMPDAKSDLMWEVGMMDGQSIDQWIINNPKIHQKYFDKEAPYSFYLTIQDVLLKRAFLNASEMAAFISLLFGKVQNKKEFVLEELGRTAMANYIVNAKLQQHFHLVSMYNASHNRILSTTGAMHDADFLRYLVAIVNNVSDKMESMSVLFNGEGRDRFTPKNLQHLFILSDIMTQIQTESAYAAFHDSYIMAKPDMKVPYWQALKSPNDAQSWSTISTVKGTDENGVAKTLPNVIGILFDRDCMGTFREEERVYTTPVNARGVYYNTFWHENQMWFNAFDENCVIFFLD